MISGTSAPRCAWCRARRGQSALGRAATAGRGPGAVRRAQVGGLLWPGLAGPAAQQPGRGGAQLDPGLGRRTDVAAAGQAERGYRAGPQGQCPRAGAGAGRVQALAGPARAGHRLCPGAAEWRPPRRGPGLSARQDPAMGRGRAQPLPDAGAESGTHRQAGAGASRHGPLLHADRRLRRGGVAAAAGARDVFRLRAVADRRADQGSQDKLAEERQLLERFKSG